MGLVATLKAMTAAATVMVTGTCPNYIHISSAPKGAVIDFTGEVLSRVDLDGVSDITVTGFVSTDTPYQGLNVTKSANIKLVAPRCVNPGTTCINVIASDHVDIARPWISGSSGDGIDIGASTNVYVHDGTCEGNKPTPIHADCVQLGSAPGSPVQHIIIRNMTAIGQTQGFTLWDHADMGANDIKIIDNHAKLTAATNCVGIMNAHLLVVAGNDCRSPPGPSSRSTIRVRFSPGAVITGNTMGS